jgi:predicted RNA-binding protein
VRGAISANSAPYDPGIATWILTGSVENFRINVERGFDVIGFKERRRNQALEFEPGDEIVFYVTGVQAFGGIARVRSEMFEDREPIWPQGKKKHPEDYPWRVEAEPVLILEETQFVPAESLLGELEHLRKWPPEHWHLAFQGQLRTVSDADAALLGERIAAAAQAPAPHG